MRTRTDGADAPRPTQATGAETNPEHKKRSSGVYLLGEEDGPFVKIGMSRNIGDRASTLQTASPRDLNVLGVVPGGRNEEAALHYAFAELHVRNEWYRDDGRIATWFAARALAIDAAEHGGRGDAGRLSAVRSDVARARKPVRRTKRTTTAPTPSKRPVSAHDRPDQRLLRLVTERGGTLIAGQREIARLIGVSSSHAHRLLHDLSGAGLVSLTPGRTGTVVKRMVN